MEVVIVDLNQTKKEKVKAYNKQYYAQNKQEIATKLYKKEACPKCSKMVSHQNFKQHQASSVCRSKLYNRDIEAMKTEIDNLKLLVTSLSKKDDKGIDGEVIDRPNHI